MCQFFLVLDHRYPIRFSKFVDIYTEEKLTDFQKEILKNIIVMNANSTAVYVSYIIGMPIDLVYIVNSFIECGICSEIEISQCPGCGRNLCHFHTQSRWQCSSCERMVCTRCRVKQDCATCHENRLEEISRALRFNVHN